MEQALCGGYLRRHLPDVVNIQLVGVNADLDGDGRYILLGVEDDGSVPEVNRNAAADIKKNFISMVSNPKAMNPPLFLSLDEIEYDGKLVLFVSVPISSQVETYRNRISLTAMTTGLPSSVTSSKHTTRSSDLLPSILWTGSS
ncbi:MAG: ATP-binding protein [Coriobacteriaceae bacterium]|nr:ATP-binding protein [Coriobacteriaceae bacterium]